MRPIIDRRILAGSLAVGAAAPCFECRKAMRTCATGRTLWVVICVLVKRDIVCGVPIAEDVAAFAAMMSSCPVVETAHARGFVAHGGFGIGLYVLEIRSDPIGVISERDRG